MPNTEASPYRILKTLEITDTCEVLLATVGDRKVVIKRLLAGAEADSAKAESFTREASAYARLDHPGVVRLIEVVVEDGRVAMVLEHVEGTTLEKLLEDLYGRGQELPRPAALYVASRVFAALAAAHAAKDARTNEFAPVIHRDVCPANVLLTKDGDVKLGNFGFAKLVGTSAPVTAIGIIKGTFGYMAPEQVLERAVTVRADVYCAALLARELLTGKASVCLAGLTHLQALQKMADPQIDPLETVCLHAPPAVADALGRALEVDAEKRDVTAAELQDVLATEAATHPEEGREALVGALEPASSAPVPAVTSDQRTAVLVRAHFDAALADARRADETVPSIARQEQRRRGWLTRIALFSLALPALSGLGLGTDTSTATAQPSGREPLAIERVNLPAPSTVVAISETLSNTPTAPTVTTAPTAPTVATLGDIQTVAAATLHRFFVDGRLVGNTGDTVRVPCGTRSVRLGIASASKSVQVPCGGVVRLE